MRHTGSGAMRLTVVLAAIAALWFGVLPRVAKWSTVQNRIDFLRRERVDPAAFFYTDLEITRDIDDWATGMHREDRDAFWRGPWAQHEPRVQTNRCNPDNPNR